MSRPRCASPYLHSSPSKYTHVSACARRSSDCATGALVGISVIRTRLVGCFDKVREMPDEAAGDASIGDAVIEDE